jgi:hypothetical protein
MRSTSPYWKDDIADLRSRAENVFPTASLGDAKLTSLAAARCLHGIVRLVARRWTVDEMQRTCAELVRCDLAWQTSMGVLPHTHGVVSEQTQLIASVVAGILPLASVNAVRDAVSFWATEDDPAVWSAVAKG